MATKMNPGFMAMMAKKKAASKDAAPAKMAKGGSVDGIAKKGKTKGKMITMKKGGKAC